jgi:NACHT domain
MAGTGKSTIARTVARQYNEQGRLGASFFFSRGGEDVGNARKFFGSIATQLANMSKALKSYICEAIKERTDIAYKGLPDQWSQLILRPLSRLDGSLYHAPLILVVDALDECDDDDDIQTILQLLAETRSLRTVQLRVFITSRSETRIRHGFYQNPETQHQCFVLHSISPSIVNHDIFLFLEHNFGDLRQRRLLSLNWPGEQAITHLVRKSGGLFIWAATAHRFVSKGGPFIEDRLSKVLQGDASPTAPEKQLIEIYITVLKSSINYEYDETEEERLYDVLRATLGTIVVLFAPLSVASLARLLHIARKDVDQTLYDLHSILDIPQDQAGPIRLHHPSFRDFLLNKDRCGDSQFYVDEKKAHEALADHCMQLMSNKLERDICGLEAPGTYAKDVPIEQIEQRLPEDLRYACQYWVQHLKKSEARGEAWLADNRQVHTFLRQHLLHWLEALSLMRKTSEGVHAIILLESVVRVSCELKEFEEGVRLT